MLATLKERANADAWLVTRGKYLTASFLLDVGGEQTIVRISKGAVTDVLSGPFITPTVDFALITDPEAWADFMKVVPPPGRNDLFALLRNKRLELHGNLHTFMTHIQYFKDLLASVRGEEVAAEGVAE